MSPNYTPNKNIGANRPVYVTDACKNVIIFAILNLRLFMCRTIKNAGGTFEKFTSIQLLK